jgi:DNA-binding winged helix-turn-helix (wHTH) protein
MSALPEKIALRHLLQDFVHRLDETIVELTSVKHDAPVRCRFCEDNIVAWQDQQHVFRPSTYNLLRQFFDAPNMILSKEDVRQDVLNDDEASEGSIRQCILEARKELRRHGFPYRIETIVRKGYRLIAE